MKKECVYLTQKINGDRLLKCANESNFSTQIGKLRKENSFSVLI